VGVISVVAWSMVSAQFALNVGHDDLVSGVLGRTYGSVGCAFVLPAVNQDARPQWNRWWRTPCSMLRWCWASFQVKAHISSFVKRMGALRGRDGGRENWFMPALSEARG
jgi:hypothetical protein